MELPCGKAVAAVPRCTNAVGGKRCPAAREVVGGKTGVPDRGEGSCGNIICGRIDVWAARHKIDAVGHQLDMTELLGSDRGYETVERLQLSLVAEVEALEEIIVQG